MNKNGWKAFDFGSENNENSKSPIKKRNRLLPTNTPQKISHREVLSSVAKVKQKTFNFHNAIIPRSTSELAIHPKKIQEIESWLKYATSGNVIDKNKNVFLLITGPSGSGKTITVNVLCKSLGISVSEWINPMDSDYEMFPGPGQVTRFTEFLMDSKYVSLFDSGNTKKVVVIKDFPNVFLKQPEEFFNILEECYSITKNPVIFICTDSSSSNINLSRILFPEEILLKYSITHYTFNSCANTFLKNALKRAQDIVKNHPDLFKQLSSSTIEAIITSCMGDIRSAMNQFYVASLIGSDNMPVKQLEKSKTLKRKKSETSVETMTRDENLGLFHGIGRVLNPKRIPKGNSWRLHCDVGKLVDEFSTHPSIFTSFLFENYLQYFGDINDVSSAVDTLSFVGTLLENWDRHDTLVMALWVSVLGVMVSNEHRVSKWNQIRGPKKITKSVAGTMAESQLNATDKFYFDFINKSSKYHKYKI